ncbi:cupredoxin domain-containing protein [Streptomyces sp. NA04227]|uniref:cupredoxin domain-containing protein n=1 Tax=Streptomyces sp. NA04227 TaxID=2742136 RepID=UPI0015928E8D|nr:cupredoxin domain-containing protein [Streptomyces sp. NA04227]QKW10460.1 cupredoxin domain-containing protein [Streptomyces sp. NA04227]
MNPPHHHRLRRILALAACLPLSLTLASCSDDGDSGGDGGAYRTSPPPSKSAPASEKTRITIKNFTFEPDDLTVRPGQKVTVVNEDSTSHTVTATGDKAFDTGTIDAGETATFTAPDKAGKYAYLCTIHQQMKGSLTVR